MKPPYRLACLAAVSSLCFHANESPAKPPSTREPKPAASATPSPAANTTATNPLAAWLLEQDGQKNAIALPLGEVLRALTHQPILPFHSR